MTRAQWEDCKACGGDHWTKDHPVAGDRCPSCGHWGVHTSACLRRRHAAALMAYVLQGSEASPTVEESFEMANRLLDFASSGEMRKTTAIPGGARLVIDVAPTQANDSKCRCFEWAPDTEIPTVEKRPLGHHMPWCPQASDSPEPKDEHGDGSDCTNACHDERCIRVHGHFPGSDHSDGVNNWPLPEASDSPEKTT